MRLDFRRNYSGHNTGLGRSRSEYTLTVDVGTEGTLPSKYAVDWIIFILGRF